MSKHRLGVHRKGADAANPTGEGLDWEKLLVHDLAQCSKETRQVVTMRGLTQYLLLKELSDHVLCDIHTSDSPWQGHPTLTGSWAVPVPRSMAQSGLSFPFLRN